MVPIWYHPSVDVNVKGLDPDVLDRLAQQAEAEGVSQQEWIRQVLRRTAARLSPAELVAQREIIEPMSRADFGSVMARATDHQRAALRRLGARQPRR